MGKRRATHAIACVLAALAVLPATAAARPHVHAARVLRLGARVLKYGMTGADVFHLQVLLTRDGFRVAADGGFGIHTLMAVDRAQRDYGLGVDGWVGAATLAALRSGPPGSCPSVPGPGDSVTRWSPVVACVLGMLHQPQSGSYISDVLIVIGHESAGNPNARNDWDVNAKRGDPSRGLMQVIGRVFDRFRSPMLPNSIYNPAANIYAALSYASYRYGSIDQIPGVKSIAAGGNYVPYRTRQP